MNIILIFFIPILLLIFIASMKEKELKQKQKRFEKSLQDLDDQVRCMFAKRIK